MFVDDGTPLGNVFRCNVCHGDGRVRCDYCNGSGNELGTCSICNGSGQITFEEFDALKLKRAEEEKRRAKEAEQRAEEAKRQAAVQAEEQAKFVRLQELQEAQQQAEAERQKQQAEQHKQKEQQKAIQAWQEEVKLRKATHRCLICGKHLGAFNALFASKRQEHEECIGKPPSW